MYSTSLRVLRDEVVDRLARLGAGRSVARQVERQQIDALQQLVVVDGGDRPARRRRRFVRGSQIVGEPQRVGVVEVVPGEIFTVVATPFDQLLVQHRGARNWQYDPQTRRIMPEAWSNLYDPAMPCFTVFEALAVARELARIGAGQRERA